MRSRGPTDPWVPTIPGLWKSPGHPGVSHRHKQNRPPWKGPPTDCTTGPGFDPADRLRRWIIMIPHATPSRFPDHGPVGTSQEVSVPKGRFSELLQQDWLGPISTPSGTKSFLPCTVSSVCRILVERSKRTCNVQKDWTPFRVLGTRISTNMQYLRMVQGCMESKYLRKVMMMKTWRNTMDRSHDRSTYEPWRSNTNAGKRHSNEKQPKKERKLHESVLGFANQKAGTHEVDQAKHLPLHHNIVRCVCHPSIPPCSSMSSQTCACFTGWVKVKCE